MTPKPLNAKRRADADDFVAQSRYQGGPGPAAELVEELLAAENYWRAEAARKDQQLTELFEKYMALPGDDLAGLDDA